MTERFRDRMAAAAAEKKSRIVVSLDPAPSVPDPAAFAENALASVAEHVCAVKMNFQLIAPLSAGELRRLTGIAHSSGLQCIADIKLNDIENTNQAAVELLVGRMGFDAIIANPFIGAGAFRSLAAKSREIGGGVIALVYMSHPGAKEGYGLRVEGQGELYRIFLARAHESDSDGVVIGAPNLGILSGLDVRLPVYSPGIGAQGGDAQKSVSAGADYLIVGRSIIEAKDPGRAALELKRASGPAGY